MLYAGISVRKLPVCSGSEVKTGVKADTRRGAVGLHVNPRHDVLAKCIHCSMIESLFKHIIS